jgi:hypothetical protein
VIVRLKRGAQSFRKFCGTEWQWVNDQRKKGFSWREAVQRVGGTIIVLTIAHLDHDKNNNRFENLAALCQKCHLNHDLPQHINNRKYGRNYNREHQLKIEL